MISSFTNEKLSWYWNDDPDFCIEVVMEDRIENLTDIGYFKADDGYRHNIISNVMLNIEIATDGNAEWLTKIKQLAFLIKK